MRTFPTARIRNVLPAACGLLLLASPAVAAEPADAAPAPRGDYIEARTADVFTGPCFSNAELFVVGDRAVMAWSVVEGSFDGVDLSGLGVAAAVAGTTTFPEDRPEDARAVVIVDEGADAAQRDALVAMARRLAGPRLDDVAAVYSAPIELTIERSHAHHDHAHAHHLMPQSPPATFTAGELAAISTRTLTGDDCLCGNEVVAYPPLSEGVEATPAFTLGHAFRGEGLESRWDDPNARSAFVGRFAL